MTSNMQLLSFLVSYLFGICFYFITIINFKLINTLKVYIQHIITFVYVMDMIIIYIIIFYNLNKGYFHIYFIIMVFIGYLCGYLLNKKIISKIDVNRLFKH